MANHRMQTSTFTIIFVIATAMAAAITPPAFASKVIWDDGTATASVGADFRFRYETDDNSRAGKEDRSRDRQRIRARLEVGLQAYEVLAMGIRLSTGSQSLQSQHQTLGHFGQSGSSGDFGVDRAFMKISMTTLDLILGKQAFPMWNPNEALWDDDIQPEGIALAWSVGSPEAFKMWASAAELVVAEGHWDKDDTALAAQAGIEGTAGLKYKLAAGMLSFSDGDPYDENAASGLLPAGSQSITHVALELWFSGQSVPIIGAVYATGDSKSADIGGVDSDNTTLMAYAEATLGGLRLHASYWDVGYGSQPQFGMFGQDNFPYSSNFTGIMVKASAKLSSIFNADVRYYSQKVKNEDIGVYNSDVAQSGAGNDRTRIQVNLNAGF